MKMYMKSLNLDRDFTPTEYEEIEFSMKTFSGGEKHIVISAFDVHDHTGDVTITKRVNSMDCLMEVVVAKAALHEFGIKNVRLIMPYIPYARQDRKCYIGEAFTLKCFTDILNLQNFDKVDVMDPHSDVAPALINNCRIMDHQYYVSEAINETNPDGGMTLISPDAGSNKKANVLFSNDDKFDRLVKCDKKRDPKDGSLSGFEVFADDLNGAPCMIVDDICDGGGTFLGLAKELKAKNAGDIYLFTTHGIYSKGLDILTDVFKRVYTTDSIISMIPIPNFKQFKIQC